MKQFQFEFKNENNFRKELARIKRFCLKTVGVARPVFQFFTQVLEFDELKPMIDILEVEFPLSYYYGCQSFGNILDGKLSFDKTLIVCSVWECESTHVEELYIDPLNSKGSLRNLDDLWKYANSLGWVKGIEIISSYTASEILKFGEGKISLKPDIKVFGSIAIKPDDIMSPDSFVFSKRYGVSNTGMMAYLLGGEDVSVDCFCTSGWDGLGKTFRITDCEGKLIHEIDNEPAANIYKKYLGLDYDDEFVARALRFPLLVETNGMECVRVPMIPLNKDDIELTVKPSNGAKIRFAFGETSKILESINENVKKIYDFAPDTIRIYSCAARRLFWGDDRVSEETSMLEGIASTIGFYTRGELMRVGDYLQYLNATIVICLVREGEAVKAPFKLEDLIDNQLPYQETSKSLLRYVEAVSQEIEGHHNQTIQSIANTYSNMFEIDLVENKMEILKKTDYLSTDINKSASELLEYWIDKIIEPKMVDKAKDFFNLATLSSRLANRTYIYDQFVETITGWVRAQFIPISYSDDGNVETVILTIQNIDEQMRKEESLLRMSYTDEQTGLSNRNCYEIDTRELEESILKDKFVYISMDINGLKKTNDKLGHDAGDELITGVASCIKEAMTKYGKGYRIGGDEFAVIIYANDTQLKTILEDFYKLIGEYKCKSPEGISVSIGIVTRREFPKLTFNEIEKIADDRMYQHKASYYKKKYDSVS